jgi:hypothetical protein
MGLVVSMILRNHLLQNRQWCTQSNFWVWRTFSKWVPEVYFPGGVKSGLEFKLDSRVAGCRETVAV